MAISEFLPALRRPKSLMTWADDGSIRTGEHDPVTQAANMFEDNRRRRLSAGEFEPRGNSGMPSVRSNAGPMNRLQGMNQRLGLHGKNFDGMNVVYDQRPEMQQKQLNLQKQGMAEEAKLEAAKQEIMKTKMNDDYIDNRRDSALKQKQVETADWAARNLKPGEMSDQDKMQAEYANRHALNTQNNLDKYVATREANQGREETARIAADAKRDAQEIATQQRADAADSPERKSQELSLKMRELALTNPELANALSVDEKGNYSLNNTADEMTRRKVANALGYNTPSVGGVGSAALGTNVGQLGVPAGGIGGAKLDPRTGQLTNPGDVNKPLIQRNKTTGARRISRDGGKTWQPL